MPQKLPSVFYHLQTINPVSATFASRDSVRDPFVMYHLQESPGWGCRVAQPILAARVERFLLPNDSLRNSVSTCVSYHLQDSFKMPQNSPSVFYHLQTLKPVTTCVPYHLRDFVKIPQKSPSVFYHLQTLKSVTTCVSYHLQKTPGGGWLDLV